MYRWWHFLAESAARALPFPTSQRPTSPLSFTPGGTPPARPSAASVAAGCEPFSAFQLLPGPSTCPAWLSAVSAASRCEPFSPNRLTPAPCNSGSGPGTMAAGAREQAASCDAFVLSRRLPAPDAPPSRTSQASLVAKLSPNHGPVTSWPGLPPRIPSGSVKGTPSRQRSGRRRHDRRGLVGWVGHEYTA